MTGSRSDTPDDARLKARLRARAQGVALGIVAKEHRSDYARVYAEELSRLHRQAGLEPPVLRGPRTNSDQEVEK